MADEAPLPLAERNCSWARALDVLGDKWSLLILRETMGGLSRFSEIQRSTGIAKNILTTRLETLCRHGVLKRVPQKKGSPRSAYVMTPKGLGLFPIIVALGQWGDKWIFGAEAVPITVVERETREPIEAVAVFSKDGKRLQPKDVALIPGPGASEGTAERIKNLGPDRD